MGSPSINSSSNNNNNVYYAASSNNSHLLDNNIATLVNDNNYIYDNNNNNSNTSRAIRRAYTDSLHTSNSDLNLHDLYNDAHIISHIYSNTEINMKKMQELSSLFNQTNKTIEKFKTDMKNLTDGWGKLNVALNNANATSEHPHKNSINWVKILLVAATSLGLLAAARHPYKVGVGLMDRKTPIEWLNGLAYYGFAAGLATSAVNALTYAYFGKMFKDTTHNFEDCKRYVIKNLKSSTLTTLGLSILGPGGAIAFSIILNSLGLLGKR